MEIIILMVLLVVGVIVGMNLKKMEFFENKYSGYCQDWDTPCSIGVIPDCKKFYNQGCDQRSEFVKN